MFTPLARLLDLAADRGAGVPVTALAEAFTALCTAHPGGPAYGVFSLRSHAEAFLHWAGSVKDPRPSFARRLEADAPALRAIVERARDGAESAEAAEFRAAFAYGMGVFDTAAARGDLTPASSTAWPPPRTAKPPPRPGTADPSTRAAASSTRPSPTAGSPTGPRPGSPRTGSSSTCSTAGSPCSA